MIKTTDKENTRKSNKLLKFIFNYPKISECNPHFKRVSSSLKDGLRSKLYFTTIFIAFEIGIKEL